MIYSLLKIQGNDTIDITELLKDGVQKRSTAEEISEELSFSIAYTPKITNINLLNEGDKIIFRVDGVSRFNGIIVKKSISKTELTYSAFDYGWYFNKNEEVYQFNSTVSENVRKICSDFGIAIGYLVNIPTKFNKIVKGSLSSIIKEMTELAEKDQGVKYYWYVSNNKFYLEKFNSNPVVLTSKYLNGQSIADYIADYSSERSIDGMYNAVKVVESEENKVTQLAYQQNNNSINKFGKIQKLEEVNKEEKSKALNIARNTLKNLNKVQTTFSITTLGNVNCRANKVLSFSEPLYNFTGNYKIKQCTHNFNNHGYTMNLELEVI